jgi:putative ABC transport system permease protein
MIFDALVVGHIRSNFMRALVSIVAIAFGVATALALRLAGSLTLATLDSDRALFANHLDFQIVPFGNRVPDRVYANVRYLEGIESAAPIVDQPLTIGVNARTGSGGVAARLLGVDVLQPLPGVTGFAEGRPGPFAPVGSFIDPAALIGTNGAIVSARTAKRFRLHRGSRIAALAGADIVNLTIANVLPQDVSGIDSSVVFVDVTTAQSLFAYGPAVDRIDIVASVAPSVARARIARIIGDRARIVDARDGASTLGDITGTVDATFGALAAIALILGGLLVFNAVGTSITQRRGDIGTLRALGVAPHQIVATFVYEGAAYGAIGATFGVALGAFAVDAVASLTHATYAHGAYDLWPLAEAFGAGVAIAIVCSIVPALSAVSIAPAIAARRGAFENASRGLAQPLVFAAASAVCFATGIVLGAHPARDAAFVFGFPLCFALGGACSIPVLLRLLGPALRRASADAAPAFGFAAITIGAIPKRIGIALGALAIAVYATVAFDIASVSFQTALERWAAHGIAGDLLVRPADIAGSNTATFERDALVKAQATPGVAMVSAIRTIHTASGSTDVSLRGDDAFVPTPQARSTEAPAQLSGGLAAALHVVRGDALDVRAPHRTLRLRVADVRPDFSSGAGDIVVTRRVLHDAFGDDRIDALRVTIDPRADITIVRTALTRALAPQRLTILTVRELRDRLVDIFAGTFAFAGTLGNVVVAIAVLGVASTLATLVFERGPELRTLRRLGATRRTIATMLFLEAFAIATIASVLGLALGAALAAVQLGISDPVTLGFQIPMIVPVERIALVIAASIGAATLGTIFSLPSAFGIATDGERRRAP